MISEERLEILNRIKQHERDRFFDTDVENDPPTKPLYPQDIDYLRKKWKNKLASMIVSRAADKGINDLIKNNQIIIKEVIGLENIKDIKGAAFITSNHFHPFENMALYKVFKDNAPNKHKFWRVIREGNYTAPPKGFDKFFKHCNTLPLSGNTHTMGKFLEALKVITKKKSYILIYPEQYMWWNYKKPRPFKDGAFKFAYRYNTPIIPCFITMADSKEHIDGDGLPVQEYTIHIMKPIYKDPTINQRDAVAHMREQNFNAWKEVYERVYNKALSYSDDGEDA